MGSSAINYSGSAGGRLVQLVKYETGDYATGSATIPNDNSRPLWNEGTEFMNVAITPTNEANILKIDVVCELDTASAAVRTVSLFKDGAGTDECKAAMQEYELNGRSVNMAFTHYMVASGVIETEFGVRAGANTGDIYLNGVSGSPIMGGSMASSITVSEIGPGIGGGATPTYQ